MALTLHFHPLASFCWKVLIALYENDTPFEPVIVDLGDERSRAAFLKLWPMGKMPVLVDAARDRTVPESTIIVDYLAAHYPGASELIPADPELARQTPARRPLLRSLRARADAEDRRRHAASGRAQRSLRRRAGARHARHRLRHDRRRHALEELGGGRRLHARRLRGLSRTLLRQQGGAFPEPVSPTSPAISSGCRGVRRCCACSARPSPISRCSRIARRPEPCCTIHAQIDLMFQALADPARRLMVERLSRGPASVSELASRSTCRCRPSSSTSSCCRRAA